MRHSLKTGLSFGLTSGTITTLGLMIGLYSAIQTEVVVIGGVLTIAIADALSDAFGIHITEESENHHTSKEIWEATMSTFLSKFVVGLTFVVPLLLFELSIAILMNITWGLLLLTIISFIIAKEQKKKPWKIIAEHLIMAIIVIIITYNVGDWISLIFGNYNI
jgi:VIT1/CCC1 family predicted Fe2+/Mn2+ transporter